MKISSVQTGRFALTGVAAAALCLLAVPAWALGLGRLAVQSALGETLRAEIDVTSLTPEEASTLQVRIAPADAYRAAGVDYNAVLTGTRATLARRADGRPYLRLQSDRAVQEPFVDVILEMTWASGRLVREYTLLFDPPKPLVAPPTQAAVPVAPVIGAAPPAPAVPAAAPAPAVAAAPTTPSQPVPAPAAAASPVPAPAPAVPAPVAAAPKPAVSAPAPKPRPAVAAAPAPADGRPAEVRVRSGDTLSRIAQRNSTPGVSLDQMLVSLYRGNPQAFVGENMNRLKSGVVLSLPTADAAQAVPMAEARRIVQAQTADFSAFRQRLAGAVPTVPAEAPSRQAAGKVQAEVQDKKPAAASPDQLKLSQSTVKPGASPEAQASNEAEKRDTAARVVELSRNVEELKKLSEAAKPAAPPLVVVPPVAPAAKPAPPAAAPAPAAVAAAPAPAPSPTPAPSPASTVAPAEPAAAPPAPTITAAAPPSPPPAPAAAPVIAPPVPAAPAAPSFVESLLDNPFVLPGAGLAVALLAGLGFYRLRRRARPDSGETSFMESRLQPDSFFGVSGGQRIDTHDAPATSSAASTSYSLSQLDAIGDVDPVAEADVYLAYGRDLQAEEILKEAMRANPERLAIRTKLLEVYAKRRDTKGYELLATQLYALTRGEGDDWAKAQEMGLQIDPENPLYQPGGAPPAGMPAGSPTEPLGPSTMPQSVLPSAAAMAAGAAATAKASDTLGVDLDLDLDLGGPDSRLDDTAPVPFVQSTQTLAATARLEPEPSGGIDIELPPLGMGAAPSAAAPASAPAAGTIDFDFGTLSLDLNDAQTQTIAVGPPPGASREPAASPFDDDLSATLETEPLPAGEVSDFGDEDDGVDPLQRKLELAEEFRQIGDVEGARDLLEEVVARGGDSLKAKAQAMMASMN